MALTTLTQSDQKRSDVLGLWFYLTTAKAQLAAAQDVGDLGTSIPGTWPSLGDGVAESWLSKALDPTDDLHLALANARGPWNLYTSTSNVGWNSIARAALGADATPNLIMQVWLLLMTRYDIRTAAELSQPTVLPAEIATMMNQDTFPVGSARQLITAVKAPAFDSVADSFGNFGASQVDGWTGDTHPRGDDIVSSFPLPTPSVRLL